MGLNDGWQHLKHHWQARLHPVAIPFFLVLLLLSLSLHPSPTYAQQPAAIQVDSGFVRDESPLIYRLPSLAAGSTIYVRAEGVSGNLDPWVGIAGNDFNLETAAQRLNAATDRALEEGSDPLVAIAEVADEELLVWNDDGGAGYTAELTFPVANDGDYQLLVASAPLSDTAGTVRLAIGLNAPEVLDYVPASSGSDTDTGLLQETGETIAILDERYLPEGISVQELTGTLTAEKAKTFFTLDEQQAGRTLYAYVQATSGNLHPILQLRDYGNKLLSTGNYLGRSPSGQLQYAFQDTPSKNFRLEVLSGEVDGQITTGEFRLLVGIDAPDVLDGTAPAYGDAIARAPIEVGVGIKIDQITEVDQKEENFGIVALLKMEWLEPELAFSPDRCQCRFKQFTGDQFVDFMNDLNLNWPSFTITNQQGRRFTQNQVVLVYPTGMVQYFERFTVILQAPYFDFRAFPFDSQLFFFRIISLFPEEFFRYTVLEEFSGLGNLLGEEEWVPAGISTSISSVTDNVGELSSRFSFEIKAHRHLNYYIIRIFIPIVLIVIVSWVPSFLGDFSKRVDIANGTLLLFIAFNFTISNDLPRLGYLTFLDTLLLSTFVLTGLVLIYNVILKRLESHGRVKLVRNVDRYTVWLHPLIYAISFAVIAIIFV